MTDKHSKNNSNENKFFDISFDEPIEDSHSNRKIPSEDTNESNNHPSSNKWDNFYDDFQEEQQERYSDIRKENSSNSNFNQENTSPDNKIDPNKSNLMINRSIKRVQKLFSETNEAPSSTYSDIKSAKSRDLNERAKRASLHTNNIPLRDDAIKRNIVRERRESELNDQLYSDKNGYKPDFSLSDTEDNKEEPLNNNNSTHNAASDLPSPDRLLAERERRRKERIAQLEGMSSDKEIEDSYQTIKSPSASTNDNHEDSKDTENKPIVPVMPTPQVIDPTPLEGEANVPDSESQIQTNDFDDVEKQAKIDVTEQSESQSDEHWADSMDSIHVFTPDNETASAAPLGQSIENPAGDTVLAGGVVASTDSEVETEEEAVDPKTQKRQKKKDKYSLKNFSLKDKTFFGINVTFNVIKRLIMYLIIIIVLAGALVGGTGIGFFANLVANTPPPTEREMAEQINRLEQQSTLYYADGNPIANVRTDIVRSVANLNDISNYIVDGFIATEDEYFAEHPGIVPKALLRAVLQTFLTGSGTGGSTLTQQLVKQQMLTNDVTFFRKANEILLALRLENYFSKEEILTAYLNVSPFGRNNNGDNVAGIVKAAEGIFGVAPEDVSLNQAAFLAGLPQDPYTYTPYDQNGEIRDEESLQFGIERMNEVLYRMYREEKITKDEYETAIAYDITQDFLPPEPREEIRQSYLYQAVMNGAIEELMLLNIQDDGYSWKQVYSDDEWYNEYYFAAEEQLRTGGYRVYSTIDKEIYDQLQESARAYEDQLGAVYDGVYTDPETGVETYYVEEVQTGLVAIDNNTGAVLGFVAGTDFENNQIDHAFQMRRSPGSTIKPMAVYGPAVENDIINPSTVIPDTAFVETYEDGSTWAPTNYGSVVSDTLMTARTALLRSDNIPAVRIYDELRSQGIPVIDYLERMGFNTIDSYTEEDTNNLAFSLGGVTTGPTVLEETRAFSTFANGGEYVDGHYIERIEDAFGNVVFQQNEAPTRVFSEDTNYIMVDMLRDTMTEGTGRTANEYMNVPGDWIAKSGISENSKDIWFIASTPSITIGSWIGYDSRYADYTIDVNDGFDRESVRSQIYWSRIVNDLYGLRPEIFGTEETFVQPDSVREQTVLEQTGTLPGRFTYNGNTYQLTGPTKTELFKVSNPAPELTFDFMLGATEEDLARFWNNVRSTQEQQRRQQQQQQQQQSSQESDESNEGDESNQDESNEDETTENPDENNDSSDEEQPAESTPEG